MEEVYQDFGERLKKVRRSKRITQEALCRNVGISRPSLCNIEKGRQRLHLHLFLDLANALEVPISKLLED
jgi:transcriptional regulator with XRE-family HTH domain